MWEANKKAGTSNTHAIEVVECETGAVRYIRSGSIISLVEGYITEARDQETYNKAEAPAEKVPDNRKDKHERRAGKNKS